MCFFTFDNVTNFIETTFLIISSLNPYGRGWWDLRKEPTHSSENRKRDFLSDSKDLCLVGFHVTDLMPLFPSDFQVNGAIKHHGPRDGAVTVLPSGSDAEALVRLAPCSLARQAELSCCSISSLPLTCSKIHMRKAIWFNNTQAEPEA